MRSSTVLRVTLCLALALANVAAISQPKAPPPVPDRAPDRMGDRLEPLPPSQIRLQGLLGARLDASACGRLLQLDEGLLLDPFRHRPARRWLGEHAGKWLHAATLAWANTGDAALKAKLDRVAHELIAAQEPDGYLGTYLPENRFDLADEGGWDVWVHKYNLIGLLAYARYTGDPTALAACKRMGDLLINTFGEGKKTLISAGTHQGLAATSILEPVVSLYRLTGEQRYLEFARYAAREIDSPQGARLITGLLTERAVHRVATKAYEVLSNLIGLGELARATGDISLLLPVQIAWEDIATRRLYVTGATSAGERFGADYALPNHPEAKVAETCVTVSWIQLTAQLLRLTGEERYAAEIERTVYNHLLGGQHPDGLRWCIYPPLEGRKRWSTGRTCCTSSGPRGISLLPELVCYRFRERGQDGLALALWEPSAANLTLDGQPVSIRVETGFPLVGGGRLTIKTPHPATFAVRLRVPAWAEGFAVTVGTGKEIWSAPAGGWLEIPARRWHDGEALQAKFSGGLRVIPGVGTNDGRVALAWGPYVLAVEEPAGKPPMALEQLALAEEHPTMKLQATPRGWEVAVSVRVPGESAPRSLAFVPYAIAGTTGQRFQVWMLPTALAVVPSRVPAAIPTSSGKPR